MRRGKEREKGEGGESNGKDLVDMGEGEGERGKGK
jgi:hypothetical protein